MTAFWVAGEPIPQGSAKAFVVGKRAVITSDNPRLKDWRATVHAQAQASHMGPAFDGPVQVDLRFVFVRPASVSERKRPLPSVRPDVDKLSRAVLDALTTAGVVKDDALVVQLTATKSYGLMDGVDVTVTPYGLS